MLDGRVKTIHPRIAGGILGDPLQSRAHAGARGARHPADPDGGGELYAVREVRRQAGRDSRGADREHRHRRTDHDSRGGQELPGRRGGRFARCNTKRSLAEMPQSGGGLSSCNPLDAWRKKAFPHTAAYDAAVSSRLAADRRRRANEVGSSCLRICRFQRAADRMLCATAKIRTRGGALRFRHGRHRGRRTTARQGTVVQQPGGSGRRLAADQEFERPRRGDHQAHQSVRLRRAATLAEAIAKAFEADPVSAFGGVLAFNRELDEETAAEVAQDIRRSDRRAGVLAEALAILSAKKNLRLVQVKPPARQELVVKSISGGLLAQTPDVGVA